MKKRKLSYFIALGIVLTGSAIYIPSNVYADSANTQVTVRFAENSSDPTSPPQNNGDSDLPSTGEITDRKAAGMLGSGVGTSGKRLPSTGEEYNQVLSNLGWATLFMVLFFYLIGRRKNEEKEEEEDDC